MPFSEFRQVNVVKVFTLEDVSYDYVLVCLRNFILNRFLNPQWMFKEFSHDLDEPCLCIARECLLETERLVNLCPILLLKGKLQRFGEYVNPRVECCLVEIRPAKFVQVRIGIISGPFILDGQRFNLIQ